MKKRLSLLLALALIVALFAGCGETASNAVPSAGSGEVQDADTAPENEAPQTEPDMAAESSAAEVSTEEAAVIPNKLPENYPMLSENGMTLSILQSTNPNLVGIEDYGDLPWWQEVEAITGLKFEWHMTSFASMEQEFNLLVAANDLCNMNMVGMYYTEGITHAVDNEIFVDLAPYLDEYAPDYKAITMQDHIRPFLYDDNGSIISFTEIGMEEFTPNNGVIIRGDLLEEQGLDIPITYDQYEETLTKLKEAYNIPGSVFTTDGDLRWLASGKNVSPQGFSLSADGEKAVFGPVEDSFREFLQILNRWYEKGLIYKDFYGIPNGENINYMVRQMSSGDSIVAYGYCEFANMIALEEGQKLVAGYIPRDNEDDNVHLTDGIDDIVHSGYVCYVGPNSSVEEIQTICMLWNYFYTEEGSFLANYGVEGTYEMREDGTPWYTDLIINNPDGLTQTQALCYYIGYGVPAYSDYTKYNISTLTTWADFAEAWGAADNTMRWPNPTMTSEEQDIYNASASDVSTKLDEDVVRFIIGELDPNSDMDWNNFVSSLESLGVREMIEVEQSALERFNSR